MHQVSGKHVHKHQLQQRALQRQHIEVTIVILSGCRLCAALARSQSTGCRLDAAAVTLAYILALALEFGAGRLGSPYHLRRSASHGIAQGVLAVPSVLAALVAAGPTGGWQPWLHGSCAAAVAVLGVVHVQSAYSSTAIRARVPSEPRNNGQPVSSTQCGKQHRRISSKRLPDAVKPAFVGATVVPSILALTVLLCAVALAGTHQQQLWPSMLQQFRSVQGVLPALSGSQPVVKLLMWGVLAAASYCLSLQLLPGCFSLGEAALMAQGATCLVVTTAHALQHAVLLVPAAVCVRLPYSMLLAAQRIGGCTPEAHTAAVSLQGLPAIVSLVLAAAVAACLLLRVCCGSVQYLMQNLHSIRATSSSAEEQQSDQDALGNGAASAHKDRHIHDAAGYNRNSTSAASSTTVLVNAAAALAAAAGICLVLLWLCCAAAWTLLEFLPAEAGRQGVLLYWVGLLAATLPALKWLARAGNMPQIIVRKVYHLLAMGLFVPVFFWDLQLLALSLAIAFAVLVLLEVLRCMRLPLLGQAVQDFMQAFVDERDTGVIYITHFTLLLGLAIPVWLCLVMPGAQMLVHPHPLDTPQHGCPSGSNKCRPGSSAAYADTYSWLTAVAHSLLGRSSVGWSNTASALVQVTAGLSGLVIIGVGDTAASYVGKLFGRVPVHSGSSKTVEGTLAGISASLGAWLLLLWGVQLLPSLSVRSGMAWWLQLAGATAGAGLMEAATSQLDNIMLPLWYFPHLLLV